MKGNKKENWFLLFFSSPTTKQREFMAESYKKNIRTKTTIKQIGREGGQYHKSPYITRQYMVLCSKKKKLGISCRAQPLLPYPLHVPHSDALKVGGLTMLCLMNRSDGTYCKGPLLPLENKNLSEGTLV